MVDRDSAFELTYISSVLSHANDLRIKEKALRLFEPLTKVLEHKKNKLLESESSEESKIYDKSSNYQQYSSVFIKRA